MPKKINFNILHYSKNTIVSSAFSMIISGLQLLISLISIPLLIKYLGTENFGLWQLGIALAPFISILDLGQYSVFKNKLSAAAAQNNYKKYKELLSLQFFYSFFIVIVGLIIIIIFQFLNISPLLNTHNPDIIKMGKIFISLVLGNQVCLLGFYFVDNFFQTKQDFIRFRIAEIFSIICGFIIILILIYLQTNLFYLFLFSSLPLIMIRAYLFTKYIYKNISYQFVYLKKTALFLTENIKPGLAFLWIQLSYFIFSYGILIYSSFTGGVIQVAQISIAYKVFNIPFIFLNSAYPIVWPSYTIAWKKNNKIKVWNSVNYFILMCTAFFAVYTCFIQFFGNQILNFISSSQINLTFQELLIVGIFVYSVTIYSWFTILFRGIHQLKFMSGYTLLAISITIAQLFLVKTQNIYEFLIFLFLIIQLMINLPCYLRIRNLCLSSTT